MKKKLHLLIPILVVSIISSINVFASDDVITEKVNMYLKAMKESDTKVFDNLISDEADFINMNLIMNSTEITDKEDFLSLIKKKNLNSFAKNITIKIIDVQDAMAVALIEYQNDRIIKKEYLTFVNKDNNWEIMNSVSSLSKK